MIIYQYFSLVRDQFGVFEQRGIDSDQHIKRVDMPEP